MPFQSEKQRRYLWANEPEIARDWTDTYGSRVQRDNGGIMQGGVQNFLGQQPMVNAPKYWQSAPDHEMTELAYITPQERDVLVDMDMYGTMRGGPNRGPSGIMSLNGWGSRDPGQNRAGSSISAAMDRSGSAPGWSGASAAQHGSTAAASTAMSPATLKLLSERQGGDTVLSSGMRNQLGMPAAQRRRGFNPLKYIGGFFGNVGRGISGLMGMGKDFAGKMRGGINPNTGRYYTQAEYEQNKRERIANKRIQNILGREAPITATTQSNLADLYKQAGTTQGFMPEEGSTRTGRAIDEDYTMEDTLREYPITTNRIQDIQRGWDNQGITGTEASMDFANARRLMTQPTTVNVPHTGRFINPAPGATFPFTNVDPYQQNYVSPNRIRSEGIYGKGDYDDLVEQSGIGTNQRNDLVRKAAFVKDPVLKAQSWYKAPLKLRQGTLSTALGENALEKKQAFRELKRLVPPGSLTIEKYLNLAQQNKVPEIIAEDMNKQVLEAIKEQGGFGDMFPKNYSLGNIQPTIKDGRIDIDESKIDDDYRERLKYLEMGVAEGGRISKALGGRSRDI